LSLIPLLVAHLPSLIDHIDCGHPFLHRKLVLAREVMHVSDEAAHDFSYARGGFGPGGVNGMLGEVGVESGVVLDSVCVAVC
jgi:hypothetical protein